MPVNAFGQTIGAPLLDWTARPLPPRTVIQGRFCRIEPLDPARHGQQLFEEFAKADDSSWAYLPDYMGPHKSQAALRAWLEVAAASDDPLWHTIVEERTGRAVGIACYLRMDAKSGVIEVGGLLYGPSLKQTPASTEAMFLMMARAFDALGYRRYEWKCDTLNAPSRAAALRLGFQYEGTFRQHMVYRGRSRDTDWFSITDGEWKILRDGFARWLAPENFDAEGRQRQGLAQARAG